MKIEVNMPNFIRYCPTGTIRATLSPRGTLTLSPDARLSFDLDEVTHCVLYYDPDTHLIGIEMTKDYSAEGAIPLHYRGKCLVINVKEFMAHFGLVICATTICPIKEVNNYLVVDLALGQQRKKRKESDCE